MAKRKTSKKTKKNKKSPKYLFYINLSIAIFLTLLLSIIAYNLYIPDTTKEHIDTKKITKTKHTIDEKTNHERFEEKTKALEIEYVNNDIEEVEVKITKPNHTFNFNDSKTKDTNKTTNKPKKIQEVKPKPVIKDTRPILAILIDDVTTSRQIKKIKNIGYPITMAFLPPTSTHKNSAKIAQPLVNYMIHLPLEAGTKRFEETNTLHIGDSIEKIDKRIKNLKSLYPKAKYLNNHTGSKFTSNNESMDKLMSVLKKYDFIFVDSRTTAKTQAKITAKKYKVKYLARNIFLDNKQDTTYITNQLKKAIKISKKYGQAIAIGHPHSITLETLKNSKHLLKGINLVYITHL